MLEPAALKNFRPLFVTPCFGEKLCMNYVLSIIPLQRECIAAQMGCDFHFRPGDSLVTRVRNDCVAYFLANPGYTHLFWIDADIGFSPLAAFRLLLCDHDVAAGVYPLKREDWPTDGVPQGTTRRKFEELYARYTVNTGREGENGVDIDIDRDGFIKVREAPTGFMCIKRTVFDQLIGHYPELRYQPDWPDGTYPEGGVHYRFFDVMVDPVSRRYLSEDYGFVASGKRSAARFTSMPIPISPIPASGFIVATSARRCARPATTRSAHPKGSASGFPGSEILSPIHDCRLLFTVASFVTSSAAYRERVCALATNRD